MYELFKVKFNKLKFKKVGGGRGGGRGGGGGGREIYTSNTLLHFNLPWEKYKHWSYRKISISVGSQKKFDSSSEYFGLAGPLWKSQGLSDQITLSGIVVHSFFFHVVLLFPYSSHFQSLLLCVFPLAWKMNSCKSAAICNAHAPGGRGVGGVRKLGTVSLRCRRGCGQRCIIIIIKVQFIIIRKIEVIVWYRF